MKLWRISQTDSRGYDTYDSAVVAAETEDAARRIPPDGVYLPELIVVRWARPRDVRVEYLGESSSVYGADLRGVEQ